MKPIKLTMTAFGPYKDKEVIHFDDLGDNRLFVIAGNTGAGKTTIFDAICFALYGAASGQDRESNAMLRSDFAEDHVHTAVELLFDLKCKQYRILRQLGHVKKGNKTKTGERYEFFEMTSDGEIPCVDRQIVSEINCKMEQLIGLTQDQFKQIVMLPQGEFRKLLTSQTENKEEILRRLFKTETYQAITERLKQKKLATEEAFRQADQELKQYIAQIHATLPIREEGALFQTLEQENYNMNQVLQGLQEECRYYEGKIITDKKIYEHAYHMHDKKQKEFYQATTINERFAELNQKQARLKELELQETAHSQKKGKLEQAERAQGIILLEQQRNDWLQEEENKKRHLTEAKRNKQLIDEQVNQANINFEAEEKREPKREALRKQLDKLKEYLPIVEQIDKMNRSLIDLEKQTNQASEALYSTEQSLTKKNAQMEQVDKQINQLDQLVAKLPDLQEELITMREQYRLVRDYRKLMEQQILLKNEAKQKQKTAIQMKGNYNKLEQAWMDNQAVYLAAHLHDGEACPVCGSVDHPNKATQQREAVTKEQLEKARREFERLDGEYRDVLGKLKANQDDVRAKTTELEMHHIVITSAKQKEDQLAAAGKQLSAEVEQLKQQRNQLGERKRELEKLRSSCKELEAKYKEQQQRDHQLKLKLAQEETLYQERIQFVPENMRILSELKEQLSKTQSNLKKLEQAWEEVQKQQQKSKEEQMKASSEVTHAKKQLEEAIQKRDKAVTQFIQALEKEHFYSEESYQKAKMPESERLALKEELEQYDQTKSMLREQVQELKNVLTDKHQFDLTVIQTELNHWKEEYEAALDRLNKSKHYGQEAQALKQYIQQGIEKTTERERRLQRIADLYDTVRGQNNRKVSFERYLQIEYLEQIIAAGNERLKELSNGQYVFIRSDRQESHGKQSGLALDVYDAYTGQTRDVKTLSGGEKFNASLSLALGMSDVIQSFQGAISIDTMFIDEGFGTLDEEALNKAIDTLVDLQRSGRMIGIISHVQELKTIFPAVLEVSKSKDGSSRTKFIIK
ncbi:MULTISPECIES: AAA family ATPase [unclassified Virgibacillus]|uniref:AAA family ATPase n=1 Tax=unclassified Virgibacillus TaxID=2620237 RepID=UPI00090AC667|nr:MULTISPECIES: SMC family ATPase [unclassified Virgibacillus]API93690.1 exonuclease [Virgibacillus sp. 6R]MBS7429904.1 SMC family ATPase [Virgibacillus sp. 19R1-5]